MSMHRTASRSRQRGLSFFGLIFVGLFAVAAFAIGGQSVPLFLEPTSAKKAIETAKRERTGPGGSAAFKGSDLVVADSGDKLVVAFKYAREIALAGPAYLVYRFEAQTN